MSSENLEIHLRRSGLLITRRCTLRCKLCSGYIPYYENPQDIPLERLKKITEAFFSVVDTIEHLYVLGGETFMHKELHLFLEDLLKYEKQFELIVLPTNGTIIPKKEVMDVLCAHPDKFQVNISHYGEVSRKADELEELLNARGVPCRILRYHGDNLEFDGWTNMTEHHPAVSEAEAREIGKNCKCGRGGFATIQDGEWHICGRSYRRMLIGLIPRNKDEYVDLLDDTMSNEEKRRNILRIRDIEYSTSCRHCCGMTDTAKRVTPAEQITQAEADDMRIRGVF